MLPGRDEATRTWADMPVGAQRTAAWREWPRQYNRHPYTPLDYSRCRPGEDPKVMDSYVVLCRITLDQAGRVPDGRDGA